MLHRDRSRAGSFGDDAERYERSRPDYPAALVDELLSGLSDGAREVLDVGCGTGIVARMFLARGCEVLGVEPDPRMAQVARRHGVHVEQSTFEGWDADGRRFDLLVAGQAWHWVDPFRGAAKAASLLRVPGRVGLFWNQAVMPVELQPALEAAYRSTAPELGSRSIALGHLADGRLTRTAIALRATGAFHVPSVHAFAWRRPYTTAQWLDLLPTHSDHHALGPERLAGVLDAVARVVDRVGGAFEMTYRTWLVTADRREPCAA